MPLLTRIILRPYFHELARSQVCLLFRGFFASFSFNLPSLSCTVPEDPTGFIGTQAPKAKYILSVCGGAMPMYLVFEGLLSGRKTMTNKAFYRLSWCVLFI
jgi:hypothetical protein